MGLLDLFAPQQPPDLSAYSLMTPAQASPLIHQMASSIAGMGAIGGPAARFGVQTTLAGLRPTPGLLASLGSNAEVNPYTLQRLGTLGRYGAGLFAGLNAFSPPGWTGIGGDMFQAAQ